MKKIISTILLVCLVYTWFQLCYFPQFYDKIQTVFSKESEADNKTLYHNSFNDNISSLNENIVSQSESKINLEDLKANIESFAGDYLDSFSLIYYEIESKDIIEINSDKLFKPASTYKVPLNMLFYDKVFNNEIDIKSTMIYSPGDYEDGAGILQGSEDLNSPISLVTLSEYSIEYSDNIAANMLTRLLGYSDVIAYIEEVSGIKISDTNYITPKAMLAIMQKLYANEDNNPYYNTIIEYMKHTIYHDRIDGLIPRDIVAHKIGDFESYVNDVGIVYTKKPYIIIFYTDGFTYESIAEISKMVYDYNIKNKI